MNIALLWGTQPKNSSIRAEITSTIFIFHLESRMTITKVKNCKKLLWEKTHSYRNCSVLLLHTIALLLYEIYSLSIYWYVRYLWVLGLIMFNVNNNLFMFKVLICTCLKNLLSQVSTLLYMRKTKWINLIHVCYDCVWCSTSRQCFVFCLPQ